MPAATNHDYDLSPEAFRLMRRWLGWTVKEAAGRLGVSVPSVKHYGRTKRKSQIPAAVVRQMQITLRQPGNRPIR